MSAGPISVCTVSYTHLHETAEIAEKEQGELEFLGRQRDRRAIEQDRARGGLDAVGGHVERFVGGLGDLAAAQQRRDARQQFQRPQRLDDCLLYTSRCV